MNRLDDKDFDELFKHRMTDELPEFEEASWLKMEQKLRERDRVVFYRNASIMLLLLSFGIAFYFAEKKLKQPTPEVAIQKNQNYPKSNPGSNHPSETNILDQAPSSPNQNLELAHSRNKQIASPITISSPFEVTPKHTATTGSLAAPSLSKPVNIYLNNSPHYAAVQLRDQPIVAYSSQNDLSNQNARLDEQKGVKKRGIKFPISLAINTGPDFNSTSSLIGGKATVVFGMAVGVGLTKQLSIKTGLNYTQKKYAAGPSDYTFNNPNAKNTVEEIDAACKVLEIPLQASFKVAESNKHSVELNAGLSSYLMLTEKYVYKYHPHLYREDRTVEYNNDNQHILNVVDLSATYYTKLKNKKLALGITPYVKIPLSGVGAGRVPLKSSGISLNLRYDFSKK